MIWTSDLWYQKQPFYQLSHTTTALFYDYLNTTAMVDKCWKNERWIRSIVISCRCDLCSVIVIYVSIEVICLELNSRVVFSDYGAFGSLSSCFGYDLTYKMYHNLYLPITVVYPKPLLVQCSFHLFISVISSRKRDSNVQPYDQKLIVCWTPLNSKLVLVQCAIEF